MKKIFVFLLLVGVLMLGTSPVIEKVSEESIFHFADLSEEILENSSYSSTTPCGEGGNGAPPVPG